MKRQLLTIFSVGAVLSAITTQASLSLNLSSFPGSTIQFNGSDTSFQFNNSTIKNTRHDYTGLQWQITSETGGNSAVGLRGWFDVSGGKWEYGDITTSGDLQWAPVTTTGGALTIKEVNGGLLSGILDWGRVRTYGVSGGLNADLTVNVSSLVYTPADALHINPDLSALAANTVASLNLSFTFNPAKTLTQLSAGSEPFKSSYSGSISAVPELPTSIAGAAAVGLALLGIGLPWNRSGVIRIGK